MNPNKKRKDSPNNWSWTSKLYNASLLAEQSTEQSNTIETLQAELEHSQLENVNMAYRLEEYKSQCLKWKQSSQSSHEKKNEANLFTIASLQSSGAQKQDKIASLQADSAKKRDEIIGLKVELKNIQTTKDGEISELVKELHKSKRECTEMRARKIMWKKKYDELANMGAIALAKVTKESYGVTPEEFQAYKNIADTQFEVDKAQQMRTDALKMLHVNTNALEDQSI